MKELVSKIEAKINGEIPNAPFDEWWTYTEYTLRRKVSPREMSKSPASQLSAPMKEETQVTQSCPLIVNGSLIVLRSRGWIAYFSPL
jgi:hypothetical protein